MARIVVTGATGTIGRAVCLELLARGHQPVALSRDPTAAAGTFPDSVEWYAWKEPLIMLPPAAALTGAGGVIHLLGEPVSQRWSPAAKQRIRDRACSTRMLVTAIRQLPEAQRPAVLVSQSATGYYGPRDDQQLDERNAGDDFLAGVVSAWEQEAVVAAPLCRVAVTRTGVVLSPSGGALAKMLPFFRAGSVGRSRAAGSTSRGSTSTTSSARCCSASTTRTPGARERDRAAPVDNEELSKALGHVLSRPAVLPVPDSR